jgi:VWFA-related protein
MRHLRISGRADVAVFAITALVALASLNAQAPTRAMYVSVVDKAGASVPGLTPADFVIQEDRMTREVLRVERATEPMNLAVLLDNSTRATPFQRDYREALATFITTLNADVPAGSRHQIAIITLASRPTIVSDYSPDQAQLLKKALAIFAMPETGTYLLDGIIETSTGIIKRGLTRPVILAITTEGPELSDRRFQAVLQPLKESGATLHIVRVGFLENLSEDRAIALDQGSKSTGGRNENILVSTALSGLLKQIANDLAHQYKVTYGAPAALIPPESVTVSVNKPGLTARGTLVKEIRQPQKR